MKKHFVLAINNIVKYGDTDIFPFPYETRLFDDMTDEVAISLVETHTHFEARLIEAPPVNISTFSTLGYTGYRWSTQIDPYWNAYFLGVTLSLAEKIEQARLSPSSVYSYRFKPDNRESSLFDKSVTWRNFQQDSLDYCRSNDQIKFVVTCDIADFYTRIYHHRLENALDRIDRSKATSSKIKKLIQHFSGTNSYGLPVGGAASRILAELALDSVDRILFINGIEFKRYVDDFAVFCTSREHAHSSLTFISRKLMENEGLTLQKHKTSIMSKEEFVSLTEARLRGFDEDEGSPMKAKFMSLPIRYDPYSANATEQYQEIKKSLADFDLLGMLSSELQKSKINQPFTKQLVRAFAAADDKILSGAFKIIFNNILELYPIFTTILQVAITHWGRIDADTRHVIRNSVIRLLRDDSFILKTELNLAYTVRLLSQENTVENQTLLADVYQRNSSSILLTSLITQVMGKWEVHFWLSDLRRTFATMNPWQRRIFLVCSYLLGDEGTHWVQHNKARFNFIESLYRDWAGKRKGLGNLSEAL
ncbi:MAG: RNA-dependent DNA polymerase [Leptothrix sp. (in: Bacteria)]|nr:RNA-dependent DNA polymerase [Leptothrix sp. (in: b-proteobacteria)]